MFVQQNTTREPQGKDIVDMGITTSSELEHPHPPPSPLPPLNIYSVKYTYDQKCLHTPTPSDGYSPHGAEGPSGDRVQMVMMV